MILADILPNFYELYHENQQLIPKGNTNHLDICRATTLQRTQVTTRMKRVIFTLPRIVLSFSHCKHFVFIVFGFYKFQKQQQMLISAIICNIRNFIKV